MGSLVSNRNVESAAKDLVPSSKKPLPFTNCVGVFSEASDCLELVGTAFPGTGTAKSSTKVSIGA